MDQEQCAENDDEATEHYLDGWESTGRRDAHGIMYVKLEYNRILNRYGRCGHPKLVPGAVLGAIHIARPADEHC